MSLKPVKQTLSGGIPIFAKVLEVFTGGFSLVTSGFNVGSDVTLPAGSLLIVNEATRTATPLKTGVIATSSAEGTAHRILKGTHHFAVGDKVARIVGRGAHGIKSISATGPIYDRIVLATSIGNGIATGPVLWVSSAQGTDKAAVQTPNALSMYDVVMESGGGVAALRRGTAYKNRIQAHVAGHLTTLPATIQISQSY